MCQLFSCSDCEDDKDWEEIKTIEVGPETVTLQVFGDPGIVDAYKIKGLSNSDPERWVPYPKYFINGFEHEEGYYYVLKIKIIHPANPPMDSFSIKCELVSIISKTETT